MKLKGIFVAAMLLTPTAALAAPGIVTASVGLRAGPGPGFPVVDRVPGGTHVDIHGCLRGDAWCDVSWSGDRGWISSRYLEYLYRHRYVYLPDYVDVIDVPVVPFVLSSYWASHYSGRPWYHRRAHWNSYWHSHARFATQMPTDRSGRSDRTAPRATITEGRTRTGVTSGVTRQQSFANVRGAQATRERMAPANGANRPFSRGQQPIARGHEATRFSAAPSRAQQPMARGHEATRFSAAPARPAAVPQIAQPNPGRVGGPPMNARAQMGAPRAAPAMPHVNAAAPGAGGGVAAGGPRGHERH